MQNTQKLGVFSLLRKHTLSPSPHQNRPDHCLTPKRTLACVEGGRWREPAEGGAGRDAAGTAGLGGGASVRKQDVMPMQNTGGPDKVLLAKNPSL